MAMLGESMHARPDGVAVADHRPLIVSAVHIGASHDLDIGQSVMRLPVAARLAMTRLSADAAFKRLAFKSSAGARRHPKLPRRTTLSVRRVWRPILIQRCALAATFMLHAARASHCSRKMNAARKASCCERHKFAYRGSLYVAVPEGLVPGIARMWRASDISWK
jgi:hypothetical protein